MSIELSILLPCYNEEGNIPELVDRLLNVFSRRHIQGEIVLVNDGSTDGTCAAIDLAARSGQGSVRTFHHEHNNGMVAAWESGLKLSKGDFICVMDADLQNLPEDVWRLYRFARIGVADVVQGYRSSIGRLKDSRFTLSKGLNIILNTLFRMKLRDNKSGFFVCRRSVFEDILRRRLNYHHFQTFVMVAAHSKGYSIREVETLFQSRLVGKSFISGIPVKIILDVLTDLLKAIREFRLSDKRQTILGEFLSSISIRECESSLFGWRKLLFLFYVWLMPLHAWMISRNVKTYYDQLFQTQWLSPDQIKEIQEKKLRALIDHAYHHVGYYRDLFDSLGLLPSDISTIEDLQKIPLLNKNLVKEHLYFDLMSDNHDKKKILRITTSGSTGEPFVCYVDKLQLEMRWAATLRSMEWTGYRFGDPQVRLWHQTIGMSRPQIVREYLDAWLCRRLFIPAYEMSEKNLDFLLKKIEKHGPTVIDGYAESFNFLAYYLRNKNLSGIRPKGIISSAQVLTEQSRTAIESAFGCKVFDKYGSREFSGIAYESEAHDGHLVVAENFVVEIIREGKSCAPGEMGEVVITDLNNYCMPFIRYRVGDLAVSMDNTIASPCGRGLPRIGKIEGRIQSIIVGANQNFVPGTFFAHLFKDYDYIVRQYKVVQKDIGTITLKIVKGPRYDEQIFQEIVKTLRQFLGSEMIIDIEHVESIPMVHTGKQQGSISELRFDFQNLGLKESKM